MINILHIDSSGSDETVAVARNGEIIAEKKGIKDHAASLHAIIEECLSAVNIIFRDISAIAVCAGPGSYTGLRIGVSAAKGFCYALDIPLILQNKMRLLAYQQIINQEEIDRNIAILLKARDKEYFLAIYNQNLEDIFSPSHLRHDICLKIIDKFSNNLVVISEINNPIADETLSSKLKIKKADLIDLSAWAKLSLKDFNIKSFSEIASAEPFYLKEVFINKIP